MKNLFATALALGLGCMLVPTADARDDDWRRGHDRLQHERGYSDRGYADRGRGHSDRGRSERRYDSDRYDGGRHHRGPSGRADSKHWAGYDRRHGWRGDRRHEVDRTWRYDRHYDRYRYRAPARYVPPRGYYSHRWSVGYRLPPAYYSRPYYVDYRPYRLSPPPYGHHWVRVDNDVFLVALATGLITHAIHDLFYY